MIFFIFLIIIIVLIVLLLIPIKMKIICENSNFSVFFSYAFFKFNIKKNKKENVKRKSIKKNTKYDSTKNFFSYLRTFKIISPIFILFFKKIKFKKVYLFIKISSNDAKSCALTYSYVYSFVKSIINILNIKSKIKKLKIILVPDFVSSEITYFGELILSVSLLDIFSILIYGIFICIRRSKELRE